MFYFRNFFNPIKRWLWFSWSPSKTASIDIWVNIFGLEKSFRNFFSWGTLQAFFSKFFSQKNIRMMSIESVFYGNYESAIILCTTYIYKRWKTRKYEYTWHMILFHKKTSVFLFTSFIVYFISKRMVPCVFVEWKIGSYRI